MSKKISAKHWIFASGAILIALWAMSGPRPLFMVVAGLGFWTSLWGIGRDYGGWGLVGYFAFGLGFAAGMTINITLSLETPWSIRLLISILVGFIGFEAARRWDIPKRVNRWWALGGPVGLWVGLGMLNEGSLQDDTGLVVPLGIGMGIIVGKVLPWLREVRWEKESDLEGGDTTIE